MPIIPLLIGSQVFSEIGSDGAKLGGAALLNPEPLVHSPAHILRYLLIDLGMASWPVYTSNEPESPDSIIVTTDSVGIKHGRCQVTGRVMEHFGVQILVRHAKHKYGWIKADSITKKLDESVLNNLVSIPVDGEIPAATYSVIEVSRAPIFSLGKDRISKRHYFAVNCRTAIRQIS